MTVSRFLGRIDLELAFGASGVWEIMHANSFRFDGAHESELQQRRRNF